MSKNWKNERAELSMIEGTNKIMKAAQEADKGDNVLFCDEVNSKSKIRCTSINNIPELIEFLEKQISEIELSNLDKITGRFYSDGYISGLKFILNKIK